MPVHPKPPPPPPSGNDSVTLEYIRDVINGKYSEKLEAIEKAVK